LKTLVQYLKSKQQIDYIILLLKFNERITKDTRDYLNTLGKIFTAGEFYTHLCVCFTKYPLKPTKKEIIIKNESIEEINNILKEIFNIDKNIQIPKINVYFLDTEIDEDDNTYKEKFQDTVDIMINQMILDVNNSYPIDTTNLDISGENSKLRNDNLLKEVEELKRVIEQEQKRKEDEEREKIRLENEILKIKNDEKEREKKVKELNELIKIQEEKKKRNEEILRKNRQIAEENEKKQKLIKEMAKNKGIEIDELDHFIESNVKTAIGFGITSTTSFLLTLGGLSLFAINPAAGAIIAALGTYATCGGGIGLACSGTLAIGGKIIKGIKNLFK